MPGMRAKPLFPLAGFAVFAAPAFGQDAPATGTPTAPFLVDADRISTGDTASSRLR